MTTLTPNQQVSKLIRIAAICALAAVVSTIAGIAGIVSALNKKPQVVAVSDSGRIIPLVPLNKPFVTQSRVISFAEECTRRAFAHDFVNYRATITNAASCFTSEGSDMFTAAMEPLIKDLIQRRMIMTASVDPPVIVQGPVEARGRVVWIVQAKMQLFREGSKERITPQAFVVEMEVVRVELEENPRGISIRAFNVRPASV
jgi:intracellular multiplication protein IcmL